MRTPRTWSGHGPEVGRRIAENQKQKAFERIGDGVAEIVDRFDTIMRRQEEEVRAARRKRLGLK